MDTETDATTTAAMDDDARVNAGTHGELVSRIALRNNHITVQLRCPS